MAPVSIRIAHATSEHTAHPRSLASMNSTQVYTQAFTASQANTIQCLALTFAAISVASSLLTFYWFIKMRRSFRHDLVMLLIQSDMFKALWLMTYPTVLFTHGPVASDSTFCQVNGFFLTVAIESSDIAVLMIAVHSALYIFRPRASQEEEGLYPWRYTAYLIWFFFPITIASLAFVSSSNPYKSQGIYCYLPVQPFWYRLALSWVPRYLIFIFIFGIYASIYYFARKKFYRFKKDGIFRHEHGPQNGTKVPRQTKRYSVPPTPKLDRHGLTPDTPRHSSVTADAVARRQSASTLGSDGMSLRKTGTHRFIWASLLTHDGVSQPSLCELSNEDSDSFIGPSTPQPLPVYLRPSSTVIDVESIDPPQSQVISWRDDFVLRKSSRPSQSPKSKRSIAQAFSIRRRGPTVASKQVRPLVSPLQSVNARGYSFAVTEILQTRDKIRRQLRYLFIYPLVYTGMWLVPFVAQVIQYDRKFTYKVPFALTCATTIFYCSQAAVECWLFSTREKPWKHIPGSDGSFWRSFKFWSGWRDVRKKGRKFHGPGKTRDEMARDARAAYQRREEELAERRQVVAQEDQSGAQGHIRERSWWEASRIDGTMGTHQEETPNTMGVAQNSSNLSESFWQWDGFD